MKLLIRAILVLFLLQWSVLAAPVRQYGARLWQTDDGLPQNNVRAVAQTSDGYLWVATQDSLARFDGVRFSLNEKSSSELKDFSISTLATSSDGSLWIGSNHRGLLRLTNGQTFFYTEADGLVCNSVKVILPSRDGALWIGTTNGLSRFANGKWKSFSRKDGLTQDAIRALCEDRAGNIWIAGDVSLHRYREGTLTEHPLPRHLAYGAIRAIYEDRTGAFWIGLNSGLLRWKEGAFTRYTEKDGLLDQVVSVIYEDRRGTLWIGTYGGLNRVVDGRIVAGVEVGDAPRDVINSIVEDTEGSIWAGCKDGLRQLDLRRFISYTTRDGLGNNNVVSIREDRTDDLLWIGSWSGGMSALQNGRITPLPVRSGTPPSFVLGLHQDRQGYLWISADFESGLFRWKDNEVTRFKPAGETIRVIHEDRNGHLWLGSSRGLSLFRDGKLIPHPMVEKLADQTIRVIFEDDEGALWIGTNEGLSWWREGNFSTFTIKDGLSHNSVVAIHQDSEGGLWLGTAGGGLNKLQIPGSQLQDKGATNHVSRFTTKEGLFSDDVFEIIEDDHGYFWMSSRTGVFRASKKNLNAFIDGTTAVITNIAFGKRDGLASPECNSVAKPGAWKSRDGRLWFATSQGLSVVNPNVDADVPCAAPPVVIEDVIADKRKVSGVTFQVPGNENHLKHGTAARDTIPIPPGRGELEFHYTALSFIYPERIRFKYKLEGIDADWVEAGSRRLATYSNLRPGSYRFHVMAGNAHGVWNELGANVNLTLLPHFWQTWWFAGFCGALALGIVVAVVRYFSVRRLQKALARLEQQHAVERERARIAQDMHDDLGARLTEILLVSDFAENSKTASDEVKGHVQKITRSAREVIDNLDAIVWAVNPENDTLDMFVTYVCEYAEMFVSMGGISCRLDVPEKLPAAPLASETRHHLFMAIKEALNNAVKHSGASEIRLAFRIVDSVLALCLEDNGRGIPAQVSRTSNGLRNMEKRLQNIGGNCALSSEPGKGTCIEFKIPLPR